MDLDRYFLQDLKQRFEKLDYACTYKKHLFYNQTAEYLFSSYTMFDILDELREVLQYMEYSIFAIDDNHTTCIKGKFTNEKAFYIFVLSQKGKL